MQLAERGLRRHHIQPLFEREVAAPGLDLQRLQLDEGAQRQEEVVGLRPFAAAIGGANSPDGQLLKATLEAVVVERPQPTEAAPQHLCLDKGYDNAPAEAVVTEAGYVPHIRRIGEEKLDDQQEKTNPARRWVVERTFAWLSRCRAILVRYDKKAEYYLAHVKLACALLWFRRWYELERVRHS